MFSRPEDLKRKTGENSIGRLEYLEALVKEFKETKSSDAKKQVLANLANFSYDPVNYEYIRRLKIIDVFLEQLAETDVTYVNFAIAGICNLCLDATNKQYILRLNGIHYITPLLSSDHEEVLLNTLTTLMFLFSPDISPQIANKSVFTQLKRLKDSPNSRITNLVTLFLADCFSES